MIKPNYKLDSLFDNAGLKRMKDSYLLPSEKSPQDRFIKVCKYFSSNDDHAKRLYKYVSNHYVSLSSPILSYDENNKNSFPISCYLKYVNDDINSIITSLPEVNYLSVYGGGVSIKLDLREPGPKSVGIIAHTKTYDSCIMAYRQATRRGSYAIYLNIDHPEIIQFLDIRKPTGDHNTRSLNIHHCICITDKFMKIIKNCQNNPSYNDNWELIDVKTKEVSKIVSARKLWEKIINIRMETGEPYILFIDTANKFMNKFQKEKGLKIQQSNLCTEIIVPTSKDRSSLCCLSSLNLEYYDKWKNNYIMIKDVMEMLDNVILKFIEKSNNLEHKYLNNVLVSAINEKNIGIGALGLHSYFQSNLIPFESKEARELNINIFKNINNMVSRANLELGKERGEPNDIKGSGNRFTYCMAIAPTATTSIIMGNTSPSIEPYKANIYRQDTISGSVFNKNKYLEKIFNEKKYSPKLKEKIWKSIISNRGSVQHIPNNIISKKEKEIFKTFMEIDQEIIIQLAADRQSFIDQGQSVNLSFNPNSDIEKINSVHLNAWIKGLKTLYYCRSEKIHLADNLTEDIKFISCESCEG